MYYSGCRRSAHYMLQHTIKPNKNPRLMVSFWLYPVIMTILFPRCVYPYQRAWLRMQHSRGRGLLECPRKPRPLTNRRRVEREFYFPGRGQLHRLAAIYMNTCSLSTPLYNTGNLGKSALRKQKYSIS